MQARVAELRNASLHSSAAYFLAFASFLYLSHWPLLRLPYFWDEAGQFVPAALDLLHSGGWIPHSVVPNIHPPAVVAYLAAWWRILGADPLTTRAVMLLLAAWGAFTTYLLARELCRELPEAASLFAAGFLVVSPLFFAQSMLAELDAPAMLFTALALLLFLRERMGSAVAASIALVLVKETGLAVPLVLGIWLARQRRWKHASWFALPAVVLALWIGFLAYRTGYWGGNPQFTQYNVRYAFEPGRIAISLARRLYYLFVADFHWIGTASIVYTLRSSRLFASRPWRVAGSLVLAHVLVVSLFGGAVLERYLLPVMPVVYAAMAGALWVAGQARRLPLAALLVGLAASNWINPLYPFPYEDNLAFVDFVKLHQEAAAWLSERYGHMPIGTEWPMTAELSRPELGFVRSPLEVREVLSPTDADGAGLVVVFSRDWEPKHNLMRYRPVRDLWERVYPDASLPGAAALLTLPRVAHFEQRGQWVDIYRNPRYHSQ